MCVCVCECVCMHAYVLTEYVCDAFVCACMGVCMGALHGCVHECVHMCQFGFIYVLTCLVEFEWEQAARYVNVYSMYPSMLG